MIWNTGQWEDRDWSEQYVAVYRIICEPGYVALGHVTLASNKQYSYVRPESMFERNACVKEEFTTWDSNPNRIYVDFDGWEPLGRNWALTRNKMMSVWQSGKVCKSTECRFTGKYGNPIYVTVTDKTGTTNPDSAGKT